MASERLQERDFGAFGARGARVQRQRVHACKIDVKLEMLKTFRAQLAASLLDVPPRAIPCSFT